MTTIPARSTFSQEERLKSRSVIDHLFQKKQFVSHSGIRMYWLVPENPSPAWTLTRYGFAVSKRNFPRAVDRNRIKRLMREAVRLQKLSWEFITPIACMLVYSGSSIPEFEKVLNSVKILREKWVTCQE